MARETEITNARITGTMLGFEDHGVFTSVVRVEWYGHSCGFGGFSLGNPENPSASEKGFAVACIGRMLKTVGVNEWEQLRGQLIRIEHDGLSIIQIGHIIEDRWFNPRTLAEELGLR